MKFIVKTAGCLYSESAKQRLEKLGFKFRVWEPGGIKHPVEYEMIHHIGNVEINSLDELIEFIRDHDDIIMSEDTIKIYDDRIE